MKLNVENNREKILGIVAFSLFMLSSVNAYAMFAVGSVITVVSIVFVYKKSKEIGC